MRDSQAKDEVKVFLAFAEVAAPRVDLTTVQKRPEPEPDILCDDSIEGPRAFELVELLDKNYAWRNRGHRKTELALDAYFENLPADKKAAFEKRFTNAFLSFPYVNGLTEYQRKKIIPRVFEKLMVLPEGFTGCGLVDDPDFAEVLESIRVYRAEFQAPIFHVPSGGSIGDPTVSRIDCKFKMDYEATCPIELLAHINDNPMFPDEVWRGNLEKYLASQPRPLPFKGVWVFDLRSKRVKFSCDEMARPLTTRSTRTGP